MKITRIRFLGLKCFITPPFEWPKVESPYGVPDTVMVHGTNGSGKTTLLEGISYVWDYIGRAIDKKKDHPEKETTLLRGKTIASVNELKNVRFAGFAVQDFLLGVEQPTWFIVAKKGDFEEFEERLAGSRYIAVIRTRANKEIIKTDSPLGQSEILDRLAKVRTAVGDARPVEDFPNMVFVPSEGRILGARPKAIKIPTDLSTNQWLADYGERTQPDVASLLYSIRQRDQGQFHEIAKFINKFLIDKQVTDLDENGILFVQYNEPLSVRHSIHELASGEKQVVLMLAYIHRWLRPGGILLVDEPDLHLHIRISSLLVRILRAIAKSRNAQLLFSTHSPELWEEYPSERERIEMGMSPIQVASQQDSGEEVANERP